MDANAIKFVSEALQSRLTTAFAAHDIPGTVYVGPLDNRDADGASVVLFLYRLSVNADLRNDLHLVQPPDPDAQTIAHEGGLPLDLHYLLTAGTPQTGGELDALRVLGFAMQALNDAPSLVGIPVQGETVRLTLDSISSEEMSRIWTLFPTSNYRTSVVYLASPVWIDPASWRGPAPLVIQEPHRIWQARQG